MPLALYPWGKQPLVPNCIGGWMGPRAGVDVVEKYLLSLPAIEPRPLGRPPSRLIDMPTEKSRLLFQCIVTVLIEEK
jgi:hypothetical protein